MLADLLRSLLGMDGGAARPATQAAKKAGQGVARPAQPKQQMQPLLYDGYPSHYSDNVYHMMTGPTRNDFVKYKRVPEEDEGFVGNSRSLNQFSPLNMDVKNFSGAADFSGTNPMQAFGARTGNPMGFDTIPNNFTGGRTGYYQGSNPHLNNIDDLD
jgi:hypothetical protein